MAIDVDSVVSELEEMIRAYEAVEAVPIPTTILEAAKEGWELTVDAIALHAVLSYSPEDRQRDRTRVVRLIDVQRILATMEVETVQSLVLTPGDLIQQFVTSLPRFIGSTASLVFQALTRDWWNTDWLRIGWDVIRNGWRKFFDVVGVVEYGKAVDKGMKARDRYAAMVEKKALPQRNVQRVLRRKKTRR